MTMARKLRLLLTADAVGGVWIYSLELARALRPLGIEVLLAVMGPSPDEAQRRAAADIRLIDTGLPLDWTETNAAELARAGRTLAALAVREGVDLVQTCSAAVLAEAEFEQPTVAVQHSCIASWWAAVRGTPLPRDFAWRSELVAAGLHRADAVIAPTAAFAAETARIYGLGDDVIPVHNGREPSTSAAREQRDFVLTASRLWDDGKNVATLDAAAARIGVPFMAAGAAHAPHGASVALDHLDLLGQLSPSRLHGLLAERPVFTSAAVYEPFGLSVLEAAQSGCALVLSDIPTHRELWADAALYAPARDADGFAGAIRRLLHDPALRSALGEAARVRGRRYTADRMAAAMTALYAEVLASSAQGSRPLELAGAA
jgi:glycosyltransferase involved in cell wall biosynthesis